MEFSGNIKTISLIADKNISIQKMDSIKKIIKSVSEELTFFRVYKNYSENYGYIDPDCINNYENDWNWYGLLEE